MARIASDIDRPRLLHATVRGDGERTVVFGHGFGSDQRCWDAHAAALEQSYRVITFDFPGATPHTLGAFDAARHQTLFGFAEDLALLMRDMQVSRATYVGHSLGGMIGILASNGTTGVFDSVITLGSSARFADDPSTGYVGGFAADTIEDILAHLRADYAAWANGFACLMVGEPGPQLTAAAFTAQLRKLRPDVAHCVLKAAIQSDHRADVDAYCGHLTVLNTRQDPAVPWQAAQWLATHGGADGVVELDVVGHLPHLTATALVTSCLQQALRQIGDA